MHFPIKLTNLWSWWIERNGILLPLPPVYNGFCDAGLNLLLDRFDADPASLTWYIGLISGTSFTTGLAATDTAASHPGWIEDANYSQATRPAWGPGAAVSKARVNATRYTFTMNANRTIKGFFLISNDTKGGSTGTLLATGLFDADLVVAPAENLTGQTRMTLAGGSA